MTKDGSIHRCLPSKAGTTFVRRSQLLAGQCFKDISIERSKDAIVPFRNTNLTKNALGTPEMLEFTGQKLRGPRKLRMTGRVLCTGTQVAH